ncbi:MAG TPA: transcription antitermination factor NusB [Chitinophagales bacterium]|nr:transcription antitermination factor NusB [Chitinophagales bacterium]HMZ89298.1 transcription antitermination factor NusB [Chitinophagales bacterium]HNA57341.1 transcription antitermination factor NusB [Chitinophagales bacterium]HNE45902.1 transcription antitermination factor NusB [Chitinophagales bacterium]HNF68492.1 transcription antitermination factor NusB [Chitinophagales bacterium]
MLSRRGLRIKAMQTLYVAACSGQPEPKAALSHLSKSIRNSHLAYLYILHFLTELAQQVDLEAHIKKNKYLPSAEDLAFPTTFFDNKVIQGLLKNNYFQSRLKREKLTDLVDEEYSKIIYQQLKEYAPYNNYVGSSPDLVADKKMLKDIFEHFLLKNEYFDEHMENSIATWADDEFIVKGLMDEFFNNNISEQTEKHLFDFQVGDEEMAFAESLVVFTMESDLQYDEEIKPKLQNWELDRVSLIDRILMKMALTEFLHLPTVPTKVTINEYLDISKLYSTPRSREFINGILDKLMNEMKSSGRIVKTGRGLIE